MLNLNLRYVDDHDIFKDMANKKTIPACVEHIMPMQSQAFSFIHRNNNIFIRSGRQTGKTTLLLFMLLNKLQNNTNTTLIYVTRTKTCAIDMKNNIMNELKRIKVEYYIDNNIVIVGNNKFLAININRNLDSIRGYSHISDFYVDDIDLMGKPYLHSLVNNWIPCISSFNPNIIMTSCTNVDLMKDTTIYNYISTNLSYFNFNGESYAKK
ncbi:MAG: hypothetical protein DRG78_15215 [Epsilonproteobacteria bacterium]|nr:MAG: hypothetical protein DRG78_15215 [Campylobacterota bacterium]